MVKLTPRIILAATALAVFTVAFVNLSLGLDASANLWALALWYWLPFALLWASLTWMMVSQQGRGGAKVIVVGALLARLVVVFAATPQLSDDLWRYVHDGQTLAAGEHPYALSPSEAGGDSRINHRRLVTIYQPTSQWTFAAAALVAEATGAEAGVVFRLTFVLFDMIVVLLLLHALRDRGRSAWWAALYAWHPLAISEVAGSGHQEPLGVALLLTALLLADRLRVTPMRAMLAGAAFAAAVAVKPIVAPLAFAMAWSLRDRRAALAWATFAAAMMGAALYLPFALTGPGLERMRATADTFVSSWAFNSSIHGLLRHVIGSKAIADGAAFVMSMGVLLVCIRRRCDPMHTAMVYLFAALLFSSTAHPWYLLWALAFVPLCFNRALWLWSLTITGSYIVLRDRAAWQLPVWAVWCEYVPVYLLLIVSLRRGRTRRIST